MKKKHLFKREKKNGKASSILFKPFLKVPILKKGLSRSDLDSL